MVLPRSVLVTWSPSLRWVWNVDLSGFVAPDFAQISTDNGKMFLQNPGIWMVPKVIAGIAGCLFPQVW